MRKLVAKELDSTIDFFEDCTVSVSQWIACEVDNFNKNSKIRNFADAVILALGQRNDEWRFEPRVEFDLENDTHFFIFKYQNNGDVVIVRYEN